MVCYKYTVGTYNSVVSVGCPRALPQLLFLKNKLCVVFYTVICGPTSIPNGYVKYNTSMLSEHHSYNRGYSVGTMASFFCRNSYRREGPSSAICQGSGMWSEQQPTCIQSNENKHLVCVIS